MPYLPGIRSANDASDFEMLEDVRALDGLADA
jgi:hypothetical protein